MSPESVIVTTTQDKYFLDCIEQLCVDDANKWVQWFDTESGKIVDREIAGEILSVVVV